MFIRIFNTQITSCYGLLSTEVINNPVLTGSRVCLPFYSGCRYAAFPARNDQEVKNDIFFMVDRNHFRGELLPYTERDL